MEIILLTIVAIIVALALMAVLVYLQIRLAKQDSYAFGLILPMIIISFALMSGMVKGDIGYLINSLLFWLIPALILFGVYVYIRTKMKKDEN